MGNRMIVAKKVFWNCSLDITTGSISVFFSSNYTVSRHIIGNFRLLFYSSIYSVNSWFVLINLMKTGIGQSKYCTSQRLSRCLISLCSNLFDFQFSIFFFLTDLDLVWSNVGQVWSFTVFAVVSSLNLQLP